MVMVASFDGTDDDDDDSDGVEHDSTKLSMP